MSTPNEVRIREVLGQPALQRLVERLRKRLERGLPLSGLLTLTNASEIERDAVSRLLGRPPVSGNNLSISLDQLESILKIAEICDDLSQAVQILVGPISNIQVQRQTEEQRWGDLFAVAEKSIKDRPPLLNWLDQVRSKGLIRRYKFAEASTLLRQALIILERLPATGISLAELAATSVGNAHALDLNQPLAALVIRGAAILGGIESWDDSQSRRDAWASVGVLLDELSAPVLVLNLYPADNGVVSQVLRACGAIGEPCYLTLRQLLRSSPIFSRECTGPKVYVCENKNVIAAVAERLGATSQPMVCTDGNPCSALRVLLNQLTSVGIELLYHGDFDWAGIQIANTIITRHEAKPWRMSADDYKLSPVGDHPLGEQPVKPIWDDALFEAMLQDGRIAHEEQTLEILIRDLKKDKK